ncbi:MAG: hypothetical protein LBO76_08325, partial [Treponema sp.]|nr:hypothetical protein [Treponema sp.]
MTGKTRVALNMKKYLFCIVASILIVSMLPISCKQPVNEKPKNTGGGAYYNEPKVFVVDISQETDWNYMAVGKDGSSLFFNADESTGIPALMYYKPEKDSDSGFTFLFKENGLPDRMIANNHILYFGNFNGYKFDLAVVYPDSTIEYQYDIETETNWDEYDAYTETSPSVRGRGAGSNFFNQPWVKHAIGAGSCIGSTVLPFLAVGCGKYVTDIVIDQVVPADQVEVVQHVRNTIIDVFECAGGSMSSCLSGMANAAKFLAYLDFDISDEKTEQIKEVIRKIEGDALTTTIPSELLEYFLLLGIEVNSGRTPPNIEGTYCAETLQLVKNTATITIIEQWD